MAQDNTLTTRVAIILEIINNTQLHLPTAAAIIVDKYAIMTGIDHKALTFKMDMVLQSLCYAIAQESDSSMVNLFELALKLTKEPKIRTAPSDEIEAQVVMVMVGLIKLYHAYAIDPKSRFEKIYHANKPTSDLALVG